MKILCSLLFLFATQSTLGQSAQNYLFAGIEKHKNKDYKGALKDYNKSIKMDAAASIAYYNRGAVLLATGELEDALPDYNKAIQFDGAFLRAFYSRATVHVKLKNYQAALADLNKTLELNKDYPNALILRGEVHYALNDKEAACKDLQSARDMDIPGSGAILGKYCGSKAPTEVSIDPKITVDAYKPSGKEFLDKAVELHTKQDYEGALKYYDKATETDNELTDAFYNRGVLRVAMNEPELALEDFGKAIELDKTFTKPYYTRATIYVSQNKYEESLPDLNKLIELNAAFPNALILRGQIHFALNNEKACCADLNRAKAIGEASADKYLEKYCGEDKSAGESLILNWPETENWKVVESKENTMMKMVEMLRNNEKLHNWTEMGNMQTIKRTTGVSMDKAMGLVYDESKQTCPTTKLTFIEKNENVESPWVLFITECSNYKNSYTPESQLWYIVQGKYSLYMNFRAVKQAAIPSATQKKWIAFFKGGKVVYEDDK